MSTAMGGSFTYDPVEGMSLRDWFAGQAMARYIYDGATDDVWLSSRCYKIADAMLAERAK